MGRYDGGMPDSNMPPVRPMRSRQSYLADLLHRAHDKHSEEYKAGMPKEEPKIDKYTPDDREIDYHGSYEEARKARKAFVDKGITTKDYGSGHDMTTHGEGRPYNKS